MEARGTIKIKTMPKFQKNPNPFMKKYSTTQGKHPKPSPDKFIGRIVRGLKSTLGMGKGKSVDRSKELLQGWMRGYTTINPSDVSSGRWRTGSIGSRLFRRR